MTLTIFATPKAFTRHIGVAQRNAIQSWLALRPKPRVILLGNDSGTSETARALGTEHIADVAYNEFGTPLLSSVFAKAHEVTHGGLMLYVNADIILMPDIMRAIDAVPPGDFLLIGQRTNLYVRYAIDFSRPDWESTMRRRAMEKGVRWGPKAIDYFAFPNTMFRKVPPFAIGRGWWDHWLVSEAMRSGGKVIDATASVLAIHQNHDFLAGEEALRNVALLGGQTESVTTDLAPFVLRNGRVQRRYLPHGYNLKRALGDAYRWVLSRRQTART